MSQHQNCPCTAQCALQSALESIGGKWKLPVLCSLAANGASRYNELLHNVQGISNTMLSQTLKELERDRLILRREYLEGFRENMKAVLDGIVIQEPDGTKHRLQKKDR